MFVCFLLLFCLFFYFDDVIGVLEWIGGVFTLGSLVVFFSCFFFLGCYWFLFGAWVFLFFFWGGEGCFVFVGCLVFSNGFSQAFEVFDGVVECFS